MSELKDRFAHALSPEPPFETDLTTALDAAVRGGRRRRARAVASKGLAVAACAVILGGAVVAIRPGGSAPTPPHILTASPTPSDPCAGTVQDDAAGPRPGPSAGTDVAPIVSDYLRVSSPNAIPAPATSEDKATLRKLSGEQLTKVQEEALVAMKRALATQVRSGSSGCEEHNGSQVKSADIPTAKLNALVKNIAGSVGTGKISVDAPGTVTVRTDSGDYSIGVSVTVEKFDPQVWADSCSPGTGDDKPCTVEWRSTRDLGRSMAFTDGSGRADLQYVADAGTDADGAPLTVDVWIDNYVEQSSGDKTVGPTWREVGFTKAGLRAAIADSGVFS